MALIAIGSGFIPTNLSDWLNGQDVDRMNRYREFLDFYQGNQWDRRRRAAETRLTLNYARVLVRKVASYVYPEPFSVAPMLDDGVSEDLAQLAENTLNRLYTDQDLHALDFHTLIDASVLGDGAFKVTWDADAGVPLVTSIDPSGLWAWSEPDDVRRVRRVLQKYSIPADDAAEIFGATRVGAAVGNPSQLVAVVEDWTAKRVRIEVGGSLVRDEANPYGWIPYVLFPNIAKPHELWGDSDLADLLDVCRELNRRMTVLSRILTVSGNPIVVLENVTGSQGIRADEGAVWELPEDSKAYLLDMLSGGGIRLHIDYVDALYRSLHDLSETPRTSFGDSGRTLSGAALEVEIQPLVQKVNRKRRTWDRVYRERNAKIMDLLERFGGVALGGVRHSAAVLGSVLPSDREALVREETMLVASQVHSRRTAMVTLGDVDHEREWARVLEEIDILQAHQPEPVEQPDDDDDGPQEQQEQGADDAGAD